MTKLNQEGKRRKRGKKEKTYLVDTHVEFPPSFRITQDSITLTDLVDSGEERGAESQSSPFAQIENGEDELVAYLLEFLVATSLIRVVQERTFPVRLLDLHLRGI